MNLYNCNFSENYIKQLQDYRDRQEDSALKLRFIAILSAIYNKDGIRAGIGQTAELFGKHIETIKNRLRSYLTGGAEKLNCFNHKPKKPYLNPNQINQVVIFVTYENPATAKEVRNYIREKFSVTYSAEAVRKLLIKNRLKVIRPRIVPGNPPSPEEQKKTVGKYYQIRYKPDSVTLFGEVMHLIHQNFPGLCRGNPSFPPVAETNSGRKRLNILGAYDLSTYSFTHLTGEENCNAGRVIEYLELIDKKYPNFSNIYLIIDNAKYFHAKKVSDRLAGHKRINLVFLTSYAPNLNLIERFWRFAKEKLVKNKYCKEYKVFRAKVFQFLNHVDDYVDEFKTLMVEKFQIIYA